MSKETDQEFRESVIKAGLAALPGEMRAQAEAELDGLSASQSPLPQAPKKTLRDAMANATGSGLSLGPEDLASVTESARRMSKAPTAKPKQ